MGTHIGFVFSSLGLMRTGIPAKKATWAGQHVLFPGGESGKAAGPVLCSGAF